MADQGFNGVKDEYQLEILPSEKKSEFGKLHAAYRATVENTLERIQNWQCCRAPLRYQITKKTDPLYYTKILQTHNKQWVIASSFVNRFYI